MGKVITSEALPPNVARGPRPAAWSPSTSASDSREHELLLVDLWLILKFRKGLIFAVVLLAVLSAVALSFLLSPVYESRAVLEIGKVARLGLGPGEVNTIEDPVVVLQRLREDYGLEGHDRPSKLPYLDSVGYPRNSGQSLIVLTAHGRSPEETMAFLSSVTRPLLERHHGLYQQVRSTKEVQMREIGGEIKKLEDQASRLANITKSVNPGQAVVATLERGNLLNALSSLRAQRANLALSLTGVGTYSTRLIQEPTLARNPIRPNPPLYILVGVVLGVVLGIASALIAEFLAKARETSRIRQSGTVEHISN